jgi:hypothetical protein
MEAEYAWSQANAFNRSLVLPLHSSEHFRYSQPYSLCNFFDFPPNLMCDDKKVGDDWIKQFKFDCIIPVTERKWLLAPHAHNLSKDSSNYIR